MGRRRALVTVDQHGHPATVVVDKANGETVLAVEVRGLAESAPAAVIEPMSCYELAAWLVESVGGETPADWTP